MAAGAAVCVRVGRTVTLASTVSGVSACLERFAEPTLGIAVGVAACKSLTRIALAVGVCAGTLAAVDVAVAVWVGIAMTAAPLLAAGACPHAKTANEQSAIATSQVSLTKL